MPSDSSISMPGHDPDRSGLVEREVRCRRLTRGCSSEQEADEPIRRYLWLCSSPRYGHVNWHTTDGAVDPVYRGDGVAKDWDLSVIDLDAAEPVAVPMSRNGVQS